MQVRKERIENRRQKQNKKRDLFINVHIELNTINSDVLLLSDFRSFSSRTGGQFVYK